MYAYSKLMNPRLAPLYAPSSRSSTTCHPFLTTLHTVPSTHIMALFSDHIAYCTQYTHHSTVLWSHCILYPVHTSWHCFLTTLHIVPGTHITDTPDHACFKLIITLICPPPPELSHRRPRMTCLYSRQRLLHCLLTSADVSAAAGPKQ